MGRLNTKVNENFDAINIEETEMRQILSSVIDGFVPDLYSKLGLAREIAGLARRNKLETLDDLRTYTAELPNKRLSELGTEWFELSDGELQSFARKLSLRINWDNYGTDNKWQAIARIHKRATKDGHDIAALRLLPEPLKSEGLKWIPIGELTTVAPHGVSQEVINLASFLSENYVESEEDIMAARPTKAKRPVVYLRYVDRETFNVQKITCSLPAEYTTVTDTEETPPQEA